MTEQEKVQEWVRYCKAAKLKMQGLKSVQMSEPKLLGKVLEGLGLVSALDVIEFAKDDWR